MEQNTCYLIVSILKNVETLIFSFSEDIKKEILKNTSIDINNNNKVYVNYVELMESIDKIKITSVLNFLEENKKYISIIKELEDDFIKLSMDKKN